MAQGYREVVGWVGVACLAIALTVAGCGSDGSGDGGICGACGDTGGEETDGPCLPQVFLEPDSNPAIELCLNPSAGCNVSLFCRRKLGSAQRRCFPSTEADRSGPAQLFRCGGSRPNTEVRPTDLPTATPTRSPTPTFTPGGGEVTPTPTMTSATASGLTPAPTLTPEPSPTSTPDSLCGSAEEECDANDPDPCGFFCDDETDLGMPCNDECRLDFSVCINPETCE